MSRFILILLLAAFAIQPGWAAKNNTSRTDAVRLIKEVDRAFTLTRKDKKGLQTYSSVIPGRYAGHRHYKVFGRLDCPVGESLMKPENRVFIGSWANAIEAEFRPCKACYPTPLDFYPRHPHPALHRRAYAVRGEAAFLSRQLSRESSAAVLAEIFNHIRGGKPRISKAAASVISKVFYRGF